MVYQLTLEVEAVHSIYKASGTQKMPTLGLSNPGVLNSHVICKLGTLSVSELCKLSVWLEN